MRMTIDVDDELLACAAVLTGISERSVLIRDAVELLVRIETGRQLAALGGSDQAAEAAPGVASVARLCCWVRGSGSMGSVACHPVVGCRHDDG